MAKVTTKDQHEALQNLRDLLSEAFALIDHRYWAVQSEREAYKTVLAHLEHWIEWETD